MLVIDLETRPNPKLKKLFKATHPTVQDKDLHKAMATSTDFAEIVCIGIKQVGGQTRVLSSIEELSTPEWNRILTQIPLISYNGKRFDLPVIIKAGIKAGLNLPYARLSKACKPWGYADRHIDLMEALSFNSRWESLDTMLQIYLGIEKKTKGNDFFINASAEALRKHCTEDIEATAKLYLKFREMFL